MSFYNDAAERIRKELPAVKGQKEGAIKHAVQDALLNFARQDEEFARAIVQGGSFSACMEAVCKGIGTSISDLEAYRRAANFYFPGSDVRFEMRIELAPEAEEERSFADAQDDSAQSPESKAGETPSVTSVSTGASSPRGGAKGGIVLDLADFL